MKNSSAKAKFNASRQELSIALNELEQVIKNKIEQEKSSENLAILRQDNLEAEVKIIEQQSQIERLSQEVNNLQHNLEETSKENEIIRGVNFALTTKKTKFIQQFKLLVESLEKKLQTIDNIISKS